MNLDAQINEFLDLVKKEAAKKKKKKKKPKCKGTKSAPVGSPKQRSFCARHCGHKKKNTGTKTKKDPDSCINQGLRRWKCRCAETDSILAKISANMDEPDALEAVNVISKFNDLFQSLVIEDSEEAKKIIKDLGPDNCDIFDQHIDAKIEYLANTGELEKDSVEKEKNRLKKLFEDLRKECEPKSYVSEAALVELGLSS